jgi:hypothetical protein
MNTPPRPTKSALKTAALRIDALKAELAEIRESDRSAGVKGLMTRTVLASLIEACDAYEELLERAA